MTDLSNTILNNYIIRKTKKQKEEFRKLIKENYDCEIQKSFSSNNIVIGDVNSAKYIYTAHYDTPARLPFPNFITPKSFLWVILYQLFVCVLIGLCVSPLVIIFVLIQDKLPFQINSLSIFSIFSIFAIMLLYLLMNGPANKNNYNDNTSGVITLIELMNKIENKENCAFVFFDNEEKGLIGSRKFKSKYKKILKDKFLINIDCVSDGDHLLFAYNNKNTKNLYKEKLENSFDKHDIKQLIESKGFTYYPSDQKGFPLAVGIAFLRKNKKFGYYINKIHTNKDICFDERNIEYLSNALAKFNEEIK